MKVGFIATGSRATAYASACISGVRDGIEIKALADPDTEKMKRFAEQYCKGKPAPDMYSDYRQLLEDDEIEAVFVCTPDTTHTEIGIDCLKKGKHVLMEKPMATTIEDCIALYRESLDHDKVLRMGFVLRYTNVYMKIKEIIDSGKLGQIISVEAKEVLGHTHAGSFFRRWHRFSKNNGGFLNAKCSHDMDILNWLIGDEPLKVAAFGSRTYFVPKKEAAERCPDCALKHECRYFYRKEDFAEYKMIEDVCVFNTDKDIVDHEALNILYGNGVTASFTVSMFGHRGNRTTVIFGSEATLYADFTDLNVRVIGISPADEAVYRFDKPVYGHGGGDMGLFTDFVDAIEGRNDAEKSDFRAGMLSSLIALAGEESMKHGKVIDMTELLGSLK